MKKLFYISLSVLLLGLTGCNSFLQRDPLDFGDETAYFKNINDLQIYTNTFYSMLPRMNSGAWGGLYAADNNSDNQAGSNANPLFYQGEKYTPLANASEWKFENIRNLNFFINMVPKRKADGTLVGSEELIDHYLGEAYFFKAYDYFRMLSTIGDAPIVDSVLNNNYYELIEPSKRDPRNEVARYILGLLDKSYEMMYEEPLQQGRLSKDAAMLLKARVALYEATWEKYHQGTAFVPGNEKWPGSKYHPGFKFEGGSIESEYNFFFDEAIKAADIVASKRSLYSGEYVDMFSDTQGDIVSKTEEIILARYYLRGVNAHSASHYLKRTGAGTGYTRSLVESFLTDKGLPIYADSDYKGDAVMYDMLQNRDKRLSSSVRIGGFVIENNSDTLVNYKPQIWSKGNQGTPTGYEVRKWMSEEADQEINATAGTSATPVFRAAEAYLIYLEAYYERHGQLDGKCDLYWKALRQRAGVNDDYQATIAATDLSQENDLAVKSHNEEIDATLYNIRRERRSEFIAEGMRLADLKRWRSLDHMQNYHVEGFNLWDDIYKMYTADQIKQGETVSSSGISKYLRPNQIIGTSVAYNGYNFPVAHYLEPIPVSEILMTAVDGKEPTIYQNPGWPARIAGPADYNFTGE